MDNMEKILLDVQKTQKEMLESQRKMQENYKEMQENYKIMQETQDEMKEDYRRMQETQKEMKGELLGKIREVNQRLAVFQEDITSKVNILLDADDTRKEHIDVHDSEILAIRQEQFEHSVRIHNLETKVIGA